MVCWLCLGQMSQQPFELCSFSLPQSACTWTKAGFMRRHGQAARSSQAPLGCMGQLLSCVLPIKSVLVHCRVLCTEGGKLGLLVLKAL